MLVKPKLRRSIKALLRRIARRIDPPHPDQTLGNVTYAQHGEDIVLLNIFRQLAIPCPCYLDIGAHHPFHISNTALFHELGSRGVNVEANPNLIEAFLDLRPGDITLNVAVGIAAGETDFYFIDDYSGRNTCDLATAQDFVANNPSFAIQKQARIPVTTVANIYRDHFAPRDIDLLSVDVEGMDREILESTFASGIYPKVIVSEIVSGADHNQANGIRSVLESSGYFVYLRLGANYIGVRNEFKAMLS